MYLQPRPQVAGVLFFYLLRCLAYTRSATDSGIRIER